MVCENHPYEQWPSGCECGAGMPCPMCTRQVKEDGTHSIAECFVSMKPQTRKALANTLWCVCWYGNTEDYGWRQHRGPAVTLIEASRRITRSRKMYPHIIFWLEPYRQDAGASSIP